MSHWRNTYYNRPFFGFELGIENFTVGGSHSRREQFGLCADPGDQPEWTEVHDYTGRTTRPMKIEAYKGLPPSDIYVSWTPYEGHFHPVVSSLLPTYYELPSSVEKSWAKLLDSVYGDSSAFGTTLAEGREAFDLIADRCSKIYRSYKELKRGNFKNFLKHLGVDPKRKHRSVSRTLGKEASGLWLEYWFGWSPMINDIYDSAVVLTDTLGQDWISARGRAGERVVHTDGGWWRGRESHVDVVGIVTQGGQFRIENPNVALTTKLGMNNPVAIAWELVPFSFVVDWFTNVGNVLEAYSALFGFDYRNVYTSSYVFGIARQLGTNGTLAKQAKVTWKVNHHDRAPNLTRPMLRKPRLMNFGSSQTRALTAASLMAQVFISD